jgi:hypothetical protein
MGLGSVKNLFRIPGSKRHRIPDPEHFMDKTSAQRQVNPEIVAQQFQPQVARRWGHLVEIVNARKKIFCIGLIRAALRKNLLYLYDRSTNQPVRHVTGMVRIT